MSNPSLNQKAKQKVMERFHRLDNADALWNVINSVDSTELQHFLMDKAEEAGTMQEKHGGTRIDRLFAEKKSTEEIENAFSRKDRREILKDAMQPTREPILGEGAVKVPTYRHKDDRLDKVEESSGKRYCAGAYMEQDQGLDFRFARHEVVVPATKIDGAYEPKTTQQEDLLECVPIPSTESESMAVTNVFGGRIDLWQKDRIKTRFENYLEEEGLIPIFSTPQTPVRNENGSTTGFASYTVTVMDKEEALKFTGDVGELHYLQALLSGGGYQPGTELPDYRKYEYRSLMPEEANPLGELLGIGPFRDEDGEIVIDGRGLILMGEWPEEDWRATECQGRCVTGHDGNGPRTVTKGMFDPIHPQALERAITFYEEIIVEDLGEDNPYTEAYEMIKRAYGAGEQLLVVIKDDQVKVGWQDMPSQGEALFCGTFLRGHFETSGPDHHLRPDEQYRIIGGSQPTQFLKPEGRKLLVKHLEKEVDILSEKLKTVDGLMEIASKTIAEKREEIEEGDTYETGGDMLTDAFVGGGVRLSGEGARQHLKGEDQAGHINMLSSVKGRADFAVSSYFRRHICTGFGIYGYGSHHGTCADSEELLKNLWRTRVNKNYLKHSQEGRMMKIDSPFADTSATVLPAKVTHLMNRDDDGDITISLAANVEVDGKPRKVILTWGFPVVDVPVLWCMEEGTDTPFDARSEEENKRFKRIIQIFGPEAKNGQPSLEEDEVTLLEASNAWRLSNKGAKEQVDKEKIHGDLNLNSALGMVERKRKLNNAGPLTRDIERLGDIMFKIQQEAKRVHERGGDDFRLQGIEKQWENAFHRAGGTSVKIEDNLTAFKYDTDLDFSKPNLEFAAINYDSSQEVRNHTLPLDYHNECNQLAGVTEEETKQRSGTSLEEWDGPGGNSFYAKMLRYIVKGPAQKVVQAMQEIKTNVAPFRAALRRRLKNWLEDATKEEVERIKNEKRYVMELCDNYREFWSELMQIEEELMMEAKDQKEMRKAIDEWHSTAARQISLTMQALSRTVSWPGLAFGLWKDWEPYIDEEGRERYRKTSAGVALMTGRMGQVLLPPEFEVEEVKPMEDCCVVWRSGPELPFKAKAATKEVEEIAVDREERVIYTRLETGEQIALQVDEEQTLPPKHVEATEEYTVRLSATTPSQGLMRWMS